jgi:hypothetical protein
MLQHVLMQQLLFVQPNIQMLVEQIQNVQNAQKMLHNVLLMHRKHLNVMINILY